MMLSLLVGAPTGNAEAPLATVMHGLENHRAFKRTGVRVPPILLNSARAWWRIIGVTMKETLPHAGSIVPVAMRVQRLRRRGR